MNGNYESSQYLTVLPKNHKRATFSHIFSSQLLVFIISPSFVLFHLGVYILYQMDPTSTPLSESSLDLLPFWNEENDDVWVQFFDVDAYANHPDHNSLPTFQSRASHDRSDIFTYDDGTLNYELPTVNCLLKDTNNNSITSSDTDSSSSTPSDIFTYDDGTLNNELPTLNNLSKQKDNSSITPSDTDSSSTPSDTDSSSTPSDDDSGYSSCASCYADFNYNLITQEVMEEEAENPWGTGRDLHERVC
jgi:hypothetical protein